MSAAQGGRAVACMAVGFGLSVFGVVSANEAMRAQPPSGEAVFKRNCAACHGEGDGAPVVALPRPFVYEDAQVLAVVRDGRGEMPAFSSGQIADSEVAAVAAFLRSGAPR